MTRDPDPIRLVRETIVYSNEFATIHDDAVEFPGGRPGTYLTVTPGDGNPGAVIVALAEGKLGLVKVFRYPLGAWQWGFPRGFAHGPDPIQTARAELHEELGLEADLTLIGWFTPDSGVLTSRVAVVLARASSTASSPTDVVEVADVAWLTPADLQSRFGRPGYDDGMTMAAFSLAIANGCLENC